MNVICAWCGHFLGEKQPASDTNTTHSICQDCVERIGVSLGAGIAEDRRAKPMHASAAVPGAGSAKARSPFLVVAALVVGAACGGIAGTRDRVHAAAPAAN